MNAIIEEWVQKAEGDFSTALRELRARKNRNNDAVLSFSIDAGVVVKRHLDILEFFWVCEALEQDPQAVYASLCDSFNTFLYTQKKTQTKLKIAAEKSSSYGSD